MDSILLPGLNSMENPLQLKSLNHISLVCGSLERSIGFYQNVLGFVPIRRPGSFNFEGAWLFNYGIGIHLLETEDPHQMPAAGGINPKDNHISFQCESMAGVEKKLEEMEIEYVKCRVEEGGIDIDQIFFHDPDGSMIEVCNCENLPVVLLDGNGGTPVPQCSRANCNPERQLQQPQRQATLTL